MKKLTVQDFQQRLNKIYSNEPLQALSWSGDRENAEVICLNCGTHYIKRGGSFLDKRKISICKNCIPPQNNQLKTNWDTPEGYTRLEDYQGMNKKLLIRHDECGFIWSITPSNLKQGKRCPKCNKKVSKGE